MWYKLIVTFDNGETDIHKESQSINELMKEVKYLQYQSTILVGKRKKLVSYKIEESND